MNEWRFPPKSPRYWETAIPTSVSDLYVYVFLKNISKDQGSCYLGRKENAKWRFGVDLEFDTFHCMGHDVNGFRYVSGVDAIAMRFEQFDIAKVLG
jgi:hypothetical protein